VVAALSSLSAPFPSPLAAHMEARGMTQRELQRITGLPIQTITSAYHGRPIQLETAIKIAKALHVPLALIAPEHAALLDGLAIH